jgi:hypothetical protein
MPGRPCKIGLRLGLATLLLSFLAVGAPAVRRPEDSAAAWMERVSAALAPAASARAHATLEIQDGGRVIDMKVARRVEPSERRTFIEVTGPEVARGSVYEVVARGRDSLERWEFLPPIRRLRRTGGLERTDSFMGTEFTYEDLGFATPVERGSGQVARVRDSGRALVQVTSPPYHDYAKVVTLIDPTTALPVRVSFYDASGEPCKVQEYDQLQTIQGRRVPTRVVMRDLRSGSTSTLSFRNIRFDVELPEEISDLAPLREAAPR